MPMIPAEKFVALLEERDLLSPEIIAHLRRQISRPDNPVSASLIAKWLVDRGHLSRLLAQRLLTRAEESADETSPRADEFSWEKQAAADEDDLGLAPLDDEIEGMAPEKKPKPGQRASKPKASRGARPTGPAPPAKSPAEQVQPPAASGGGLFDEELSAPGAGGLSGMGPLDGLDAPMEEDGDGGPLTPVGSRKKVFGRKKKFGKRKNVWDSPLLLIGGGLLLLGLIIGGILYWALTRRSGDEMLALAEEDYRNGSYTQAIKKYGDYLGDFPTHPGVSTARVRSGLAKLRQATDRSSNWPKSLEVANEVLTEIAKEEDFRKEAGPELVAMLPKIAEGLAEDSRADLDPALVDKTREAVALVNKYIPARSRPVTKLADIEALLALTEREIACSAELQKTIVQMNEAIQQNETAKAYEFRNDLLRVYPNLNKDQSLQDVVLKVSQAELAGVKWVDRKQPAVRDQTSQAMLPTIALARRITEPDPPSLEGHVVFALANGAAYGLDATTGKILWRRPVGFASAVRSLEFPPTPISQRVGSDAIMVESEANEVLRVKAATGQQDWRHAVGERFDAHPLVADQRLLVATRSGRLIYVDLETGDSTGYVQLPQGLQVAPTVDLRRSTLYQVAEHSNLFVLSLEDGKAKRVVYLGHEPGSITVPPVIADKYLIVAENDSVEHGSLKVFDLESKEDEEGNELPPVRLVQTVRLRGRVDAPPQVQGVRVLVAADQGDLYVFEIRATDAEKPLALAAQGKTSAEEDLQGQARFPLLRSGQVWIADSQLTRYDLQATKGGLQPKGLHNKRSATLQPPIVIGQTVFHVRSKVGLPGVSVSAINAEDGQTHWETHLAAPLAAEPILDEQAGKITAVTSVGSIYQVDVGSLEGQSVVDQPDVALKPGEVREPVTSLIQLQNNVMIMAIGIAPKELSVFDPGEGQRFRKLFLPSPLGAPPMAFAGGVLVPCEAGHIFLLDPRSSQNKMGPFQPELTSGTSANWSVPVILDDDEILISESRGGLFRIGIKDQPEQHLATLAQASLTEPIVSPLAVLQEVVYAVDESQSLVAFELPELTAGRINPLGAGNAWGPRRVGNHVLLSTDDEQLYCLNATQQIVWQIPLPYGPLAGTPLELDGDYVFASTSGVIWRMEPDTGKELAKIETGLPLGTGPVRMGDQLLIGGYDGSLHKVQRP